MNAYRINYTPPPQRRRTRPLIGMVLVILLAPVLLGLLIGIATALFAQPAATASEPTCSRATLLRAVETL